MAEAFALSRLRRLDSACLAGKLFPSFHYVTEIVLFSLLRSIEFDLAFDGQESVIQAVTSA